MLVLTRRRRMIRVVRTPSLATIPRRLALFLLATMVIAAGCGASDESATERRGVDDQVESTTTEPASDQAADGQTADGQTARVQSSTRTMLRSSPRRRVHQSCWEAS
jgi:hypothetical protein